MSWLGEEERYPQGLTERCELLELLSENSRGGEFFRSLAEIARRRTFLGRPPPFAPIGKKRKTDLLKRQKI